MGHRDCVAERLSTTDDRNLVHRVGELKVVADNRVAHLVEGSDETLFVAHHAGLLLGACDDAHDSLFKLYLRYFALAVAGCQQRRFVDEVR